MNPNEPEAALRSRLGIPASATRVLVFCESSHWDTNWLRTSEEYFRSHLEPIFQALLAALDADPQRIYGIESLFFLKLYWERHPECQERIAELIRRRQLRILSSSFTTPDTLLPHSESILRDFHLGQEWMRSIGLSAFPRTAYFPDNFGHSPHLPSLMGALGIDSVALTRIDGMHFIASDYRRRGAFPLKGSTAELLERELRTLDFVWRADDGSEVLCHWNAFTYFQGDMLAHAGIIRWMGHVAAVPWRTRGHIARRINGFVRQLEPLSRTPYMLCPIGMDFNEPIRDLRSLLDRYNLERYPETGTWAVLAGLDDYFDLVGSRRADLPVLELDPNPYWMGCYSSRPELKQRPAHISRTLRLAESLALLAPPHAELDASLREGWAGLVLLNHHDAITGTSPDRIWLEEQQPWLLAAETAANQALSLAVQQAPALEPSLAGAPRPAPVRPRWGREGENLWVETEHYRASFSEVKGGSLTSLRVDGEEVLGGLGLDLLAFSDAGGLWRLGHEFVGGRFSEINRASLRPAELQVREGPDWVSVEIVSYLHGRRFERRVTCRAGDPCLQLRVAGTAQRRVTVTCRTELALGPSTLEMDTIGGEIRRPSERLHRPTFWPVPSRVSVRGVGCSLHTCFAAPTAVSLGPTQGLEWIVARNAPKERAFGLLPVLAHPIGGTVDEKQTHHSALFITRGEACARAQQRRIELDWLPELHRALRERADGLVQFDQPGVSVDAAKRADVGGGIIVRISAHSPGLRTIKLNLRSHRIDAAARCDARERDLEPLGIDNGQAVVPLRSRLTTVRLWSQMAQ